MAKRLLYRLLILAVLVCPGILPVAQAEPQWPRLPEPSIQAFPENQPEVNAQDLTASAPFTGIQERYAAQDSLPPMLPVTAVNAPLQETQEKTETLSAIEAMYASRLVERPRQFGYDLFGVPDMNTQQALDTLGSRRSSANPPMGAVQDDYVLGAGDEIEIMFTGQRTDRKNYRVTPEGMILIEDFPPIPAAGRNIGQVRLSIAAAAGNIHNTKTYVSLASVRQIAVLVIGHVKKPGRQTMTVFHTALDALMQAGGVVKGGSLRQIRLVRDGRSIIVDIYGLLMHGNTTTDLALKDGDRIIVPPVGPTVAVAGEVKTPGIYEILPAMKGMYYKPEGRSQTISMNAMLEMAGGVLAPGKNRFLKLAITPDGKETVEDIGDKPFENLFGDGSILMVSRGQDKRSGMVEVVGHSRRPGLYALDDKATLSALLSDEDIPGPDIYPLIGVIERTDPEQMSRNFLEFPLKLVVNGEFDRKLEDGDVVHLFSRKEIASLSSDKVPLETENEQGSRPEGAAEQSSDDAALRGFLKERSAFLRGAVRQPGAYPLAAGTTLDNLLAVAGGLSLEADTGFVEITSALLGEGHQADGRSGTMRSHVNFRETSPSSVAVGPGDSVRINQKFNKVADQSVNVIGEVRYPGRYDLMPGDRLSDLLERAGGFTDQAYPDGVIFSRESARKAEEARFRAQARQLRQALAVSMEGSGEKKEINPGAVAEARALASELENAQGAGRITVEGDLAALKADPALDVLLEPGDRVYVPKRSLTVKVSGEVLSPASLQFREGKDPVDYIHEAGGFTFHADKERTFVLYPDGSAQPLEVSSWNHSAALIPPGSTIVVPRDPEPFDFIESAKDISQILSNLAITSIFIDDVRDEN